MATDIYESCDRAIKEMNRYNLALFGKLKLAKWDRVNIIRTVTEVYEQSVKRAKRKYLRVGFEAYVLGMLMCGIDEGQASTKAWKAITEDWISDILTQTDFVTLYRFDTETERKIQRLAETISAITENGSPVSRPTTNRDLEIDKALKAWSRQLGQYAINVTDYAMIQAFEDAGAEGAFWDTEHDGKVCRECHRLDGMWFPIQEIPSKPHLGCRCRLRPGRDPDKDRN